MSRIQTTVSLAVLTLMSGIAVGGDLTPPSGPIGPTMKRLDVVEPRIALSQATAPGDELSLREKHGTPCRVSIAGSEHLTDFS